MINRTIILAALTTIALGACSTVNGVGQDLSKVFGPKKPVITQKDLTTGTSTDGMNWINVKGDPVAAPSAKVDLDYNRLGSEVATDNQSVQMFSLDAPGEPLKKIDRRTVGTGNYAFPGVPSSTDKSVTVFPFSDNMFTPGVKPGLNGYGRRADADSAIEPPSVGNGNAEMLPMYTGNPNMIYFEHGSSALNAAARQVIANVAQSYSGMVLIDGHASHRTGVKDPVKAGLINFQVSMKRAMAVTRALITQGVSPKAIKVTAHGDAEPARPETNHAAEKKNRRVEIRTGTK